jgi:UBX domain-containing protein 1/4
MATTATAAKSIKCDACGSLFLSWNEAQTHADVTKHAAFSESTETVRVWLCQDCGKPARTLAEKTLHERHTGHKQWKEEADGAAVLGQGGGVATEAQAKQAKQDARAEAEADAELLGLGGKAMKKKQEEGNGAGAAGAAGAGAAAGAAAMEGVEAAAAADDTDPDTLVPVSVDRAALAELLSMGFNEHRAARALHATGNAGVEAAVGWLADREGKEKDDASGQLLDSPLMIARRDASMATGGTKSTMTPEEARQKAKEMMGRAKERREREEREAAARRERDRIRAGKELQAALRLEEEGRFKRLADERRREKEEEERARAALRAKLEEDKRERRRRLGLPEELTPEELAAEQEKRRKRAEEEAEKRANAPPAPASVAQVKQRQDRLRGVLVAMKKGAPEGEAQFKLCCTTLAAYVRNLATGEDKFRRINRSNAAYRSRVGCLPQGEEFLRTVGFEGAEAGAAGGGEGDGDFLEVPAGKAVDRAALEAAMGALDDALTNPFFGVL